MSVTTKSIAPMKNGRATQFGEWVIRWRWLVILFSLLVVAGLGSGASKLFMKNDYRIFFGADNPQLKSFEALQAIYTKDDNILFVLEHPEKEAFSAEFLSAVQWLTEEAWKLPFATRVDSVTNFQHSYSEEDDLIVGDLVESPSEMDSAQLAEVRRVAMGEPML